MRGPVFVVTAARHRRQTCSSGPPSVAGCGHREHRRASPAGPACSANPSPYSRVVNLEKVRQAYTSAAELYIEMLGTSQQVNADDLAFIARHLAGRPGTVLDLGCGPGHITDYLRSMGVNATGTDMVPEFIAHARAAHPSGDYLLGSFEISPPPTIPSWASWHGAR